MRTENGKMGYLTELVVPVATAADTDSYKKASRTVRWALTWKADAASPEWAFPRPRGPWRLRRRPATDRYAPRSQVLPAGHRRVGAARRGGVAVEAAVAPPLRGEVFPPSPRRARGCIFHCGIPDS